MKRIPSPRVVLFAMMLGLALLSAYAASPSQNLRYIDFFRDDVETILQSLTLEEKIGQILIFGFHGTDLDDDYRTWIESGRLGNVKLFQRNVASREQVKELTNEIDRLASRSPSGIPPFIATDLEGGVVNHLRIPGLPHVPAAGLVGGTDDLERCAAVSRLIALNLHDLGINMNFAPCVDVLTNVDNQVIGSRSYSSDPRVVYEMARVFLEEHGKVGILATVKHFPGHGMTEFDSHLSSHDVHNGRREMLNVHLYPYVRLIREGLVDSCMGSHVIYDGIDALYPATFSGDIMEVLLRNELGFEGIVVTDDLEMQGSVSYARDMVKAFLLAFRGGNDLILISHTKANQKRILDTAVELFKRDILSEEKLDERVLRILRVKKRYLTRFHMRRGSEKVWEYRMAADAPLVEDTVREGMVCISSRLDGSIPAYLASLRGKRGLVLSPTSTFAALARRYLPGWDIIDIDYTPDPARNIAKLRAIRKHFPYYPVVIIGMANMQQVVWARALSRSGVDFAILAINSPSLSLKFRSKALFIATSFDPFGPSIDALFESVCRTGVFRGHYPYALHPEEP